MGRVVSWLQLVEVCFLANVNILAGDSNNTEKYRTATDFQNDARRMLQDYVKLGHCEGCPFEATGMLCSQRLASAPHNTSIRLVSFHPFECPNYS